MRFVRRAIALTCWLGSSVIGCGIVVIVEVLMVVAVRAQREFCFSAGLVFRSFGFDAGAGGPDGSPTTHHLQPRTFFLCF